MPPKKPSRTPSLLGQIEAQKPKKSEVTLLGRQQLFDLRPVDMARLHAGFEMDGKNPVEAGHLGFATRPLVQANLPHSNPGKDMDVWVRRNGNFTLTIQSDISIDPKTGEKELIGIPFGNIPRLVLFYLCSEAVRTKSREISLGDNLSDFLHELGLQSTGGTRGDITRLKQQIKRLVTAKIKFQCTGEHAEAAINASIAKKHFFFWDKNPDQSSLFESKIVLDADFYNEIITAPVPINLGAVSALKSSSFGLDLYTWLTYRVNTLQSPVFIKWTDLQQQVGADYGNTKDFAKRARHVISEVKTVWGGLDTESLHGGFLLKPCPPSIPKLRK